MEVVQMRVAVVLLEEVVEVVVLLEEVEVEVVVLLEEVVVEVEVVALLGPLDLLGPLHLLDPLGPRFPMQTYQHKICHLHKSSN